MVCGMGGKETQPVNGGTIEEKMIMKTEWKPAATHPWKRWPAEAHKLAEARAEARRIYDRTSPARTDEYAHITNAIRSKRSRLKKAGKLFWEQERK